MKLCNCWWNSMGRRNWWPVEPESTGIKTICNWAVDRWRLCVVKTWLFPDAGARSISIRFLMKLLSIKCDSWGQRRRRVCRRKWRGDRLPNLHISFAGPKKFSFAAQSWPLRATMFALPPLLFLLLLLLLLLLSFLFFVEIDARSCWNCETIVVIHLEKNVLQLFV